MRRRQTSWVLLLGLVLVVAIAAAAVADREHKAHRLNRASRDAWFCTHKGTRCDRTKPQAIEAAWNRRELGYVVVEVALVAGLGVLLARRVLLVRRRLSGEPKPR